jgi:hypothetical protein
MISETLTPQEVADRVRPYVASKKVGTISLSIDEIGIHLRNGYWRIPVRPSVEPEPLFPYYEALADLEQEVQDGEGIKVTIASGDPLSEDTTP